MCVCVCVCECGVQCVSRLYGVQCMCVWSVWCTVCVCVCECGVQCVSCLYGVQCMCVWSVWCTVCVWSVYHSMVYSAENRVHL